MGATPARVISISHSYTPQIFISVALTRAFKRLDIIVVGSFLVVSKTRDVVDWTTPWPAVQLLTGRAELLNSRPRQRACSVLSRSWSPRSPVGLPLARDRLPGTVITLSANQLDQSPPSTDVVGGDQSVRSEILPRDALYGHRRHATICRRQHLPRNMYTRYTPLTSTVLISWSGLVW